MNPTWQGYSATGAPEAQALRHGGPGDVRLALLAARERTLALADDYRAALGEAASIAYASEVNPPLWELGHVAWFQEWWVGRNRQRPLGVLCDPAHERLPSVLPHADAWYDSGRVAHASRWELPLPDSEATRDYLALTLERTLELLADQRDGAVAPALYFFRLVALHEQMHSEAAVYMAQALGIPVRTPATAELGPPRELQLQSQAFRLGAAPAGFAFDNELADHEVEVPAADIDAEPVSWARFLPFFEAGGYQQLQWWSSDGAAWLQAQARRQPLALAQGLAQPQQAATHLNAHEAEAWCRWAGRALPTEAQWECAALTLPEFRWGQVWEWTASAFEPYPGFTPHPYRDYSQPWFGSRRVLRGASAATAPALAHPRYRNFFEPQRRDILAGFRSIRGLALSSRA